ncbi:hypothetical protein D3C73_1144990 [compost metagenome]
MRRTAAALAGVAAGPASSGAKSASAPEVTGRAQGRPNSEKVAWARVARSKMSSMFGITAWACSPFPTHFTHSVRISAGASAVRMASSTFMKAPLWWSGLSSGVPWDRCWRRFSVRSSRPKV